MLIVDGFAGGGGASTGIEWGAGCSPTIAINHDPEAIAMHAINHPATRHYCESIYKVRPEVATGGASPDFAWFSPDCTHFSRAKGGKPVSSKRRGLAWMVTAWAQRVQPAMIAVENVAELLTWGPLGADGRPCPRSSGRYFRAWVAKLRRLGYRVEWRKLRACDYGAPTTRERLYVLASLDGDPRWPLPTHGEPGNVLGLPPWRTAAECIDWSIPCRSIFDRDKPLVDKTLARIARGVRKFAIDDPSPFIVGGDRVPSIVQLGFGERPGQAPRVYDARKPLSTVVAGGVKHELVVAFLARHFGGRGTDGSSLREPMRTVTTQDHHALVTATLDGEPDRSEQVAAFLMAYYGTGEGSSLRAPMRTVTTRDRFALVTVDGYPHRITDIKTRHLTPRELATAQGFPADYVLDPVIDGKRLSATAQVRMVGNSVAPPVAAAIVRANVGAVNIARAAIGGGE